MRNILLEGGSFCVYTRKARGLCTRLAVSETESLLHIDYEKIKADSQAYLSFMEPNVTHTLPTDITCDLIEQLIKANAAGRQALARQETQLNALLSGFEKLLTGKSEEEVHRPQAKLVCQIGY